MPIDEGWSLDAKGKEVRKGGEKYEKEKQSFPSQNCEIQGIQARTM